ncbi:hypothetical protein TRFO_15678 [Tritrichomonas foetus]|uniref:Uncharacterized protein n=1 Tax=Tritrichomonas foetus TaxID=1144522 RepID=A0A1J4KWE2_9EUKA|nr:hypothetical protein TRFO_15678 [Tritrichomonas foetus]|eukprot:OHT14022.1 hypothetical protein TRFO_15678 [Tritrichomonas foetus]
MSLLDFLLSCTSPLTLEDIAKQVGREIDDVEKELDNLISENNLRKRMINLPDGSSKSIYWASSLIPFIEQEPIITIPFAQPYDHRNVLERLTDQQLLQEKLRLQITLRKINSEYENLQHLAKINVSEESEKVIDDLTEKWMSAVHEMLYDMLSLMRKTNPEMNMDRLLKELRIDPVSVKWNAEDEDFGN